MDNMVVYFGLALILGTANMIGYRKMNHSQREDYRKSANLLLVPAIGAFILAIFALLSMFGII